MKRKVIKNTAKRVNPRKRKVYTVVGGTGHTVGTFFTLKDAKAYAKLHPAYSVKGYKKNTAKPVAKRNVAKKVNPKVLGINKRQAKSGWDYLNKHGEHQFVAQSKGRLPVSVVSSMIGNWATNGSFEKWWKYYTGILKFESRTKRHFSTMKQRHKKNVTKTRANSSTRMFNADKLDDITRDFQGREPNGRKIHTIGSDYTPSVLARLGKAVLMIVKNGKQKIQVDFGKNAFVGADARRNLYIEGKDAAIKNVQLPKKGNLTYLGQVQQLDYIDQKDHIENGELVHFYHHLGEVDKIKPNAFIDHEGFTIIVGGNYDILPEGIAN